MAVPVKANYDLSRYESGRTYRATLTGTTAPASLPKQAPAAAARQKAKLISLEKAKKDQEKRTMLKRCLLSFTIAVLMMGLVVCNATLNELTAEIGSLQGDLAAAESENTRLGLEIERGTNLSDIEEFAKTNLGMSKLDRTQTQFITLDESDKVVVNADDQKDGLLDKILSLFEK